MKYLVHNCHSERNNVERRISSIRRDSSSPRGFGGTQNDDISLQIENLTKFYGSTRVFAGFDLSISEGEVVGVVGESGAGKTTLFRCLSGLEDFSGQVVVTGSLSYMFQEHRLLPWRTVTENVFLPLVLMGRSTDDDLFKFLVDLAEIGDQLKKYPSALSGGQKQRVALVRTLLVNSDIILLDEPFKNLHLELAEKLLDALLEYCRKHGKTLLIASHDVRSVEKMDLVVDLNR